MALQFVKLESCCPEGMITDQEESETKFQVTHASITDCVKVQPHKQNANAKAGFILMFAVFLNNHHVEIAKKMFGCSLESL